METKNNQAGPADNSTISSLKGSAPSPVAAALQRERPEWVGEVIQALGETTIIVPGEHIVEACAFLKTAAGLEFNFLADLCGFDRGPEEEPRFEVNYHLFSTTKHHRVRLKVVLGEDDIHVPTVSNVWRTADWHERETYEQWLAQPDLILREIRRSFDIAMLRFRLGKLMLVGRPRRQAQK